MPPLPRTSAWPVHRPVPVPILDDAAKPDYPEFAEDFATLARVLEPAFGNHDRAAMRAQNRYRLQHTLVLIGAAVLAGLGGLQAVLPEQRWPSAALLLLGAVITLGTRFAEQGFALSDYLTERVKAERLRALYFTFLAGRGAYAGAGREQRLRTAVEAISDGEELG